MNMGLLNISHQELANSPGQSTNVNERECSKKSVQQGRSRFGARSILSVREHGKRATPGLASRSGKARARRWRLFSTFPIGKDSMGWC